MGRCPRRAGAAEAALLSSTDDGYDTQKNGDC
jgi:hypothetical protein